MKHIDRIIAVLETIRSVELRLLDEADPREKADMATTLDMLNSSLQFEIARYSKEQAKKQGGENAA